MNKSFLGKSYNLDDHDDSDDEDDHDLLMALSSDPGWGPVSYVTQAGVTGDQSEASCDKH